MRTEPIENGLRWRFHAAPGLAERIADLARREHECSRFLDFRIGVEGDALVWEARTDARARPILDELMRLAESPA